jgi:hypothetical protein
LIGIAFAAAAPAAQAQLVYPHSASEEKTANEIKAGLDAAKTAHLAAIDKHKAYLLEAIARERKLIAQRELAQRDAMLTLILDAPEAKGRALLVRELGDRGQEITGAPSAQALGVPGSVDLLSRARDLERARGALGQERANLDFRVRAFQAAGGKGEYCDKRGEGTPRRETGNETVFWTITAACDRIKHWVSKNKDLVTGLTPEMQGILGFPISSEGLRRSEIKTALQQNEEITRLADAQGAVVKAAKAHLQQLNDYYQCEVKRSTAPTLSQRAQNAAAQIQRFTTVIAELGPEKLSRELAADATSPTPADAIPERCTLEAVGADPEKRVDKPAEIKSASELLGRAGYSAAEIRAALSATERLAPARALIAAVQKEALAFKAATLSDLLVLAASPETEGADPNKAKAATALLRMLDDFQRLAQARNGTLPDTTAVLIRLAAARMKMATAAIEADRLQQLERLSDMKVVALRQELLGLLEANRSLASTASLPRALLRYSDSWSKGRLPARVLDYEFDHVEFLAWADRERAMIEAAYAVLEPGVMELQAYGAGGFKASEIASYLNIIGLTALALE